jgi:hypothetical protein
MHTQFWLEKPTKNDDQEDLNIHERYNYYVLGHYPSSHLCLKCRPLHISKHNVSETGIYLRHQVEHTHLGPIDRASLQLRTKHNDILDKDEAMDNVQERNNCTNLPLSQTFRSYIRVMLKWIL